MAISMGTPFRRTSLCAAHEASPATSRARRSFVTRPAPRGLCVRGGAELLEGHAMPDHVVTPQAYPSDRGESFELTVVRAGYLLDAEWRPVLDE